MWLTLKKEKVFKNMDILIEKKVKTLFDMYHIKLKESTLSTLLQVIKFSVVGVSNTLLSYVLNVGILYLLDCYNMSWDYIVANIISFALSVLWSFYWNNKYVFQLEEGKKRNVGKVLLKTYVSYGFTGIILNNILSYVWIRLFGISKYITPLINLIISVPLNFIINKVWAFKAES